MSSLSLNLSRAACSAILGLTVLFIPPPTHAQPPSAPAARATVAKHVLAVSLDGLNPDAIRRLGQGRAPTLHRLMAEGASTLNARTSFERTQTLPNHASMLTGRRVADAQDGHGVDVNTDPGGTVHQLAGEQVASVFNVVAGRGGSAALFASKSKFALFGRSWSAELDRFTVRQANHALVTAAREDLVARQRALTFLHLSKPDNAGHAHGFMSDRYLDAVADTDRELGRLLDAVTSTPGLRDDLVVVVTADHGGGPQGHADPGVLAHHRIPFLVWGRESPAAGDLYALNPDFTDPGSGRPGYDGGQPVRNGSLANLVSDLLGVPAGVPGSQVDLQRDLTVSGG